MVLISFIQKMILLINIVILKFFYKDYVGEELLNPFLSHTDMKTKFPSQIIELHFQIDHINPKRIHFFEEHR